MKTGQFIAWTTATLLATCFPAMNWKVARSTCSCAAALQARALRSRILRYWVHRARRDGRQLTLACTGRVPGQWEGLRYTIALVLSDAAPTWFWHLDIENTSASAQRIDLIYVQDLALAPYGALRLNEYYVSQYLDHTPLTHGAKGVVVASRQNQAVGGRYPWSVDRLAASRRLVFHRCTAVSRTDAARRYAAAGAGARLAG